MTDKDYLIKGEMYQYNLGWLIEQLMSFKKDLATAIDLKTIKYADPIQWDITTQYPANTVVVDPKSGTAYMSKVPVPAGIELTNTNYWVVVFNYQDIYNKIMDGVAFNDRDQDYATKDLLVNDLVWYAGDLYRVTQAISTGSKYIPGTNLVKTTIESLLARYYGRDRTAQVSNDTVNVSGDYTITAGNIAETSTNRTVKVAKDREIDVDGSDSVHVDGASTLNVRGLRTEFFAGNKTEDVTGAYTGKFGSASFETGARSWNVKFPDKTVNLHDIPYKIMHDIRSYGAIGDGLMDCTQAIQDAITAAEEDGYPVFIPAGVFKTGSLYVTSVHGVSIIGERSGHFTKDGSCLLYSGTDTLFTIKSENGAYNYRLYFANFDVFFQKNASSACYLKNIQESTFENVAIWGAENAKASKGFDIDSAGIVNIDNCIISHCDTAINMKDQHSAPNPQDTQHLSITRCNIYRCIDAIVLKTTIHCEIFNNWIEGFKRGVVFDESSAQSVSIIIRDNSFWQTTVAYLAQGRALYIAGTKSVFNGEICGNLFNMGTYTESAMPEYAIEFAATDSTIHASIHDNYIDYVRIGGVLNSDPTAYVRASSNDVRSSLFGLSAMPQGNANVIIEHVIKANPYYSSNFPINIVIPKGLLTAGTNVKLTVYAKATADAGKLNVDAGATTVYVSSGITNNSLRHITVDVAALNATGQNVNAFDNTGNMYSNLTSLNAQESNTLKITAVNMQVLAYHLDLV